MLHRTLHLSLEYFLLIHPRKSSIPKCILNISWQPPVDPFVTLNIDGSTFRQSRICWRWGSDKRLSREMNHWISPSHRFNNQQYSWALGSSAKVIHGMGRRHNNFKYRGRLDFSYKLPNFSWGYGSGLGPFNLWLQDPPRQKMDGLSTSYIPWGKQSGGQACKKGKGAKQPTENLFTLSIFFIL